MPKRHLNVVGNLESLFLRLEELVLANSGEDEFEEVFKLIIAKLWDERVRSGSFRVHSTEAETAEAISKLLRQADKAWPGILDKPSPQLTREHLSVCVEALAKHTISNEGFEVMDAFFEFMVAKGSKGAKGQYFTPRHVIELCVRMIKPQPHETVLDPACGSGGFLIHALNYVKSSISSASKYCERKLWGFDIDSRAVRVAKALMVLAGDGNANIIRLNSLLQPSAVGLFDDSDSVLTIEDVCRSRMKRHNGYDVIMTNPPFAGEVREKRILDGYALAAKKGQIERDVLFVERCVHLLRPGGRMAIVLPHNKFATDSYTYLREWLLGKARVLAVVGLGRNTFLPHTHQKASVLFLQKTVRKETKKDYPIFFSISERDGKNSKGQLVHRSADAECLWERVDHDFADIEKGFVEFCREQGL